MDYLWSILSNDEKYVIIFFNVVNASNQGHKLKIFVLDLQEMEWRRCNTVCPDTDGMFAAHQVVKMENSDIGSLIVNGYIRYIAVNQSVSFDVMGLIMSYYSNNEWICVLRKLRKSLKGEVKKNKNMAKNKYFVSCWMIGVSDIISNLQND